MGTKCESCPWLGGITGAETLGCEVMEGVERPPKWPTAEALLPLRAGCAAAEPGLAAVGAGVACCCTAAELRATCAK